MTNREREVFNLIKNNPLLSQKEIADKMGITRSSVATHILNLGKKGYIKGKGYICSDEEFVVVIGGSNVDLIGIPDSSLSLNDSNPGDIKLSFGGVGRNIAENLAKLDVNTKLISALGKDMYGDQLYEHGMSTGIDMSHIVRTSMYSTSTYLAVLDSNNDMKVAIADMKSINAINERLIKQKSNLIKQAKYIVLDTNLNKEMLEYLFKSFPGSKFLVDTVSCKKAPKIKEFLPNIYALKPNKIEAQILSGVVINTIDDAKLAASSLIQKGVNQVFLTLGEQGVVLANKKTIEYIPNRPVEVVNATGAGDAFMAGIVYGLYKNLLPKEILSIAMRTSKICLESSKTVSDEINIENVLEEV